MYSNTSIQLFKMFIIVIIHDDLVPTNHVQHNLKLHIFRAPLISSVDECFSQSSRPYN